ncbi:serine/threonine-protein kinase PknK [Polyangium fumosum]|uniref:Serine/threonine-protein kinase PknK n=1 Tax=Polyangium fumosum TaxID=889272 RepID=A0A4U1J972_9BACT|nr:serine/threonine-protein kinase [Polyangium fumosum]TKD04343.1 serine/threonine-protein kinase PknK [Polyangium fumosum]
MARTQQLIAGRFQVEREVGRGAVGIVFRAFDTVSQRRVALKIIAAGESDPGERTRLLQEGKILSELDHPGIVQVVAYGALDSSYTAALGRKFDEGTPFIAMEWLEGEDLLTRQLRAALTMRQALDIARQVAFALAAAHDAGVVHRDIKPSNIFVLSSRFPDPDSPPVSTRTTRRTRDDGEPVPEQLTSKLVDFGVATSRDMRLTGNDIFVGTPAYMAPEQARGDAIADARSDIYSLGATLFELLTGRPPHIGSNSIATIALLATTPAPRLSELLLDVPEALEELVARMLMSEREHRPTSSREVALELDALCRDPSVPEVARALATSTEPPPMNTRLVTTLVALQVGSRKEQRLQLLERLRERGADALPLGTDSIVAHLGMRQSHGDEATNALDLGRWLAELGACVGVSTGRTRLDRVKSAGDVVDRASALARKAGEANLLCDGTTKDLDKGFFQFDPVPGGHFKVGARAKPEGRKTEQFIGREAELINALAQYERCVDDGTPIIVTISGPPGIGKSRLGREFVNRITTRDEPPLLVRVRCESFGRAQALGVATDALRAMLGLPKGASLEQVEQALRVRKLRSGDSTLLSRLLANQPFDDGLDPRGARDSLYLSMTELALGAASSGTCVLLFEDAQWSDPESISWIEHLLGRATNLPLFVMMVMRPGFWRDQGQRFVGRDHVRIDLRPMSKKATREIARAIIGEGADEAVLNRVAEQAAGSPLFAEELARVIAAGKDVTTAATIEAAIQVSLDALDDATREAVVRMSVLGLSVWDSGISAVGVADADGALKKLIAAELLVEHGASRFAGTREFLFKHALVRDVAYASANEELRKQIHAAAAAWLANMGEDAATVAQHFDLGAQQEKAAVYWETAARRALATNSLGEAVKMAERSLMFATDKPTAFGRAVLLDEAHSRLDAKSSERKEAIDAMAENVFDEESEIRSLGARVRYDYVLGAGFDVEARLIQCRDRAATLGLVEEEARCSASLANLYAYAGQLDLAERETRVLLDLTERRSIDWAAVDAWQALAVVRQTQGQLGAALDARRNAARAAKSAGLQEREAMLITNVGFALTTIGARHEALHQLEAGLAKASAIGSPGTVRNAQMNLLCWAATFGPDSRLDGALTEPRTSADEATVAWFHKDRVTLGTLFYRGCELLRTDGAGNIPRARSLLKTATEAYRASQNRDVLPVALGFWAEAERRFGNSDQAIELACEAARLVESGAPSLLNEASIYLTLHDAYVDIGDLKSARDAIQRAVPHLERRLKGLEGTPYARAFLVNLPHNAGLLAAAEAYGCVTKPIEQVLALPLSES